MKVGCVRNEWLFCTRQGLQGEDLASLMCTHGDAISIVPLRFHHGVTPVDLIEHVLKLKEHSSDRLRLGMIKVVADGSIQGFSARLRWPGYYNGADNGLWYISPEQLREIINMSLEKGIHTHTNNTVGPVIHGMVCRKSIDSIRTNAGRKRKNQCCRCTVRLYFRSGLHA